MVSRVPGEGIDFLMHIKHPRRRINFRVNADISSIRSGPALLERRHVKCRGDTVSEHGFNYVSDGTVNDIFDPNEVNSWVCFRSVLDPFLDEGEIKRALDPTVSCTERVRVVMEVPFDESAFTVKREWLCHFRRFECRILNISPQAVYFFLGLRCRP